MLPEFKEFPLPDPSIPENVIISSDNNISFFFQIQRSVAAILAADAPSTKEEYANWVEELKESKFARNLVQADNGVRIPPSGWKCSRCDLTENLWLNLTEGVILCGRKNWDGSGGNGHALEYFKQTGNPLCVKLGTISADIAKADVFSYAEDDSVLDPLLAQHLAHFGINVNQMEKTEKTTAELQIDINLNYDWSRLQEQDKKLQPLFGPVYTGMQNIGNSCYLASVMQTLFSIPEFQDRYYKTASHIFQTAPQDPTSDFQTQM
jgi:ubiquitin carboxyl-terminal hydrolase 5/13